MTDMPKIIKRGREELSSLGEKEDNLDTTMNLILQDLKKKSKKRSSEMNTEMKVNLILIA